MIRFPVEGLQRYGAIYALFAVSNDEESKFKNLRDSQWYLTKYYSTAVSRVDVEALISNDACTLFYQKRGDAEQ